MGNSTQPSLRQQGLRQIRRLVRGLLRQKGVHRLNLAQLRQTAARLLATRPDWLTPRERALLAGFVAEANL